MIRWLQNAYHRGLTLRMRALLAIVGVFLLAFAVLFYTLVQVIERNQLNETRDVLHSNASLAAYDLSGQDAGNGQIPEVPRTMPGSAIPVSPSLPLTVPSSSIPILRDETKGIGATTRSEWCPD